MQIRRWLQLGARGRPPAAPVQQARSAGTAAEAGRACEHPWLRPGPAGVLRRAGGAPARWAEVLALPGRPGKGRAIAKSGQSGDCRGYVGGARRRDGRGSGFDGGERGSERGGPAAHRRTKPSDRNRTRAGTSPSHPARGALTAGPNRTWGESIMWRPVRLSPSPGQSCFDG